MAAAAKDAIARSVAPESEQAKQIVKRYGTALAAARGGTFDEATRRGRCERFEHYDPRASRYCELLCVLNGNPSVDRTVKEWEWISGAVLKHFA